MPGKKTMGQRKRTTSQLLELRGERLWIHETKPADATIAWPISRSAPRAGGIEDAERTPRKQLPAGIGSLPTGGVQQPKTPVPLHELGNQGNASGMALPRPELDLPRVLQWEFRLYLDRSCHPTPLVIGDTVTFSLPLMPARLQRQHEVCKRFPTPMQAQTRRPENIFKKSHHNLPDMWFCHCPAMSVLRRHPDGRLHAGHRSQKGREKQLLVGPPTSAMIWAL